MSRYILKIELQSDLCVSDGGVYNSMLDIDICYDRHGFPYIPARRIKGCLRECALELNDWGEKIPLNEIFGSSGEWKNAGKIRISDAVLSEREECAAEVSRHDGSLLYHPQNVLNYYSYIRTQTRIDYETGAAEDNSLRTMRVANKGLLFVSEIEIDGRYYEDLKKCAEIFTNMGIGRTRGLGEIRCELEPAPDRNADPAIMEGNGGGTPADDLMRKNAEDTVKEDQEAALLSYRLDLEEPMICKSVNGGESRTLDYIEGSKILGIILSRLRKDGENIPAFLDGSGTPLIVSNAYLTVQEKRADGVEEEKRLTEVPAYIYGIKNDDTAYINKLYGENPEEKRQLNSMKHCYVYIDEEGVLHKADVRLEERYHHRRPEDKSVGRAVEVPGGDSAFYQISSITEGQSFSGYITGSREQIRKIREVLASDPVCRAGYGSSAEYGKSRIHVTGTAASPEKTECWTERIVAVLTSPAIVYNEKAMYSVSSEDLLAEILAACGLKADDVKSYTEYVKYTMLGGFNVTWNRRKPVISAFDQGTALDIRFHGPVSISADNPVFIGERNLEGYGECRIETADGGTDLRECGIVPAGMEKRSAEKIDMETANFGVKIAEKLLKDYIARKAAEEAAGAEQAGLRQEQVRPVISNMLLMCRDSESIAGVSEAVDNRYKKVTVGKQDKLNRASQILELCGTEKIRGIIDTFSEDYDLEHFEPETEKYRKMYLENLLNELKYQIRYRKGDGKNEE